MCHHILFNFCICWPFIYEKQCFGYRYVAPEYANTGLLNERSDVYSFGVLLMEIITGRDPVDYNRATGEVIFFLHNYTILFLALKLLISL